MLEQRSSNFTPFSPQFCCTDPLRVLLPTFISLDAGAELVLCHVVIEHCPVSDIDGHVTAVPVLGEQILEDHNHSEAVVVDITGHLVSDLRDAAGLLSQVINDNYVFGLGVKVMHHSLYPVQCFMGLGQGHLIKQGLFIVVEQMYLGAFKLELGQEVFDIVGFTAPPRAAEIHGERRPQEGPMVRPMAHTLVNTFCYTVTHIIN